MTDLLEAPTPVAAPGTYPVPAGRGHWRLTLHQRVYSAQPVTATVISELSEARNRKLVRVANTPAVFTFDLDGQRPAARYISELGTEVIAWRWDDTTGVDVCYFRGPITATSDTLDEQSHTVTVTATDYLGLFARRISTQVTAAVYGGVDQDLCVNQMVYTGIAVGTSGGLTLTPANYLPLWPGIYNGYSTPVNPDGTSRPTYTGTNRTFTLQGNTVILTAIDDFSKLAGAGAAAGGRAFEYDVAPLEQTVVGAGNATYDALRNFYPAQGVARTSPALYYPGNVTALSRQVTSADYTNYWRTIGNNQNANQNVAQYWGEAWTNDARAGQAGAVGLWMSGDSAADQIDNTNWLPQVAQGQLNIYSVLLPTYTLTLAPGFYYEKAFAMGDTLPLIVQSGRLNVNTTVRVVGLTFETTDDGTEVVTLTVGRPPTSLADMLSAQAADIRALSRR
jgi:hypothetical protein